MDNFDLKKYLVENKVTRNSSISENTKNTLGVGDNITNDMWIEDQHSIQPVKIVKIKNNNVTILWPKGVTDTVDIDHFNKTQLKPEFKIKK
jgi:hypothetical protein